MSTEMHVESSPSSGLLRPFWRRTGIAPWLLSVLVLATLTTARFFAALGPQQYSFLFLVQVVMMWLVPAVFLTVEGRRQIGLARPQGGPWMILLCFLIGIAVGLLAFAVTVRSGVATADNWVVSVRSSMQLDRMRQAMSAWAILGAMALPAFILTPVGEEILFRGFMQQAFAARWNVVAGVFVNCGAFGLVHLHVHGLANDAAGIHVRWISGGLFALGTALVGVVFALCRLRTRSLYGAIAAHAGANAGVISALIFAPFYS